MMILLIFFAIPFAVIVFSIALQKLLRCPFLVAAIIFSIFLVVGFAISNTNLIIAGIVYTILSFVTAYLTMLIYRFRRRQEERENDNNNNNNNGNNNNNNNIISTINNGFINGRNGCRCNRR